MIPEKLDKVAERIYEALIPVEDVVVAYVFGSTAEGKEHAFSDIDVAVLFVKEPSLDKIMRAHSHLVELLGDRVNTLPLNFAPPFIRYKVVKNGLRILSRDENARISFEAKALSEGIDEAQRILKVREAIFRGLKT